MIYLRCERVYDLGCEWFCELKNKQNPDLSPRYRGGPFILALFRWEERSLLIGGDAVITGRVGHTSN